MGSAIGISLMLSTVGMFILWCGARRLPARRVVPHTQSNTADSLITSGKLNNGQLLALSLVNTGRAVTVTVAGMARGCSAFDRSTIVTTQRLKPVP